MAVPNPDIGSVSECGKSSAPTQVADEELVGRVQAGDLTAFDSLVLRYRRKLTAVAWRFFPDSADAEDLVQDAFVRAFTNLEKLRPGVPFQNWLYRITINICLDQLRKQARRPQQAKPDPTRTDQDWLERQLYREGTYAKPRFRDHLVAQELINKVLQRISPKDRLILHLLYGEGRSVKEVASTLGWSNTNVKVRAFRARRALRNYLNQLEIVREE